VQGRQQPAVSGVDSSWAYSAVQLILGWLTSQHAPEECIEEVEAKKQVGDAPVQVAQSQVAQLCLQPRQAEGSRQPGVLRVADMDKVALLTGCAISTRVFPVRPCWHT